MSSYLYLMTVLRQGFRLHKRYYGNWSTFGLKTFGLPIFLLL